MGAGWAWPPLCKKLPSVSAPRQDLDFPMKIKLTGPELKALELMGSRASRPGILRDSQSAGLPHHLSQPICTHPESLPTSLPHLPHETPISSHKRMGFRGVDRRTYRETIG